MVRKVKGQRVASRPTMSGNGSRFTRNSFRALAHVGRAAYWDNGVVGVLMARVQLRAAPFALGRVTSTVNIESACWICQLREYVPMVKFAIESV